MPIYTRTGDDGTTSLFGGKRVSKTCVQVEAYGVLDELTCMLGMLAAHVKDEQESIYLEDIQRDLYIIMGFLALAPTDLTKQKNKIELIEKKIDVLASKLPPLHKFILPGGTLTSCWAHLARVSCRKAERVVIAHFKKEKTLGRDDSKIILMYLNRLSDLLFTYARSFNE